MRIAFCSFVYNMNRCPLRLPFNLALKLKQRVPAALLETFTKSQAGCTSISIVTLLNCQPTAVVAVTVFYSSSNVNIT